MTEKSKTSQKNRTAVVLAGGIGSRLMPHTAEIPKPLVEIGGKPVVEYLLSRLKLAGVTRVVMAVNHLADQIETCLGDGSRLGLKIEYSRESEPLSTAGPLKLIDSLPENFIVANGDIISDIDIAALYDTHLHRQAGLTVATYQGREKIDYGVLQTGDNDAIVGFEEKPDYTYTVSMGIYVFNRSVLEYVPVGVPFGFDQLILKLLGQKQSEVYAYPFDGYWLDIGRPSDYARAVAEVDVIRGILE